MAGFIKKHYPKCRIYFLGRNYTKDIIALSEHVDEFINYDEIKTFTRQRQIEFLKFIKADVIVHVFPLKEIAQLASAAGISLRVGTTNRLYHWFTCNKLIRLSRKNSVLHESQLNFKLLNFLNVHTEIALNEIQSYYGFNRIPELEQQYYSLIDKNKFNVILHPKSKGSAREWGLDNFSKLILSLPKTKYNIFISGTTEDGKLMQDFIKGHPDAINLTGKLTLSQFIAFINHCDGLVAASTGPLHIAASLGKKAIGLFSPRRPIHPGRWMPIGKNAHYIVYDEQCERCHKKEDCNCISQINPSQIIALLEQK